MTQILTLCPGEPLDRLLELLHWERAQLLQADEGDVGDALLLGVLEKGVVVLAGDEDHLGMGNNILQNELGKNIKRLKVYYKIVVL